jgi:hypothetical protein
LILDLLPEGVSVLYVRPTFVAALVPIARLQVPPFQRDYSEARIRRALSAFDERRCEVLQVSVDGHSTLWCDDGQHRLIMLQRLGEERWEAWIGYRPGGAAALFYRDMNKGARKECDTAEQFLALLDGHDKYALEIDHIVSSVGLSIALPRRHGDIQAVNALEKIYGVSLSLPRAELLRSTLATIVEPWLTRPSGIAVPQRERTCALTAPMLLGMATVLRSYEGIGQFSRSRLAKRLKATSAEAIAESARKLLAGRIIVQPSQARAVASTLVALYNKQTPQDKKLPPLDEVYLKV